MNREKALETIVVLALASLVTSLWFEINWFVYLSIGLLAVAVISKSLTAIIGKVWLAFSHYLGLVMNYLTMFIIFHFFLVPVSFFQRLTGSNHILKKKKGNSHFHLRNHLYTHKDIERPW